MKKKQTHKTIYIQTGTGKRNKRKRFPKYIHGLFRLDHVLGFHLFQHCLRLFNAFSDLVTAQTQSNTNTEIKQEKKKKASRNSNSLKIFRFHVVGDEKKMHSSLDVS